MGDFRAKTRRFWADFGLSEWQKAKRDGREPPPEPPHHYRTCRDEYCPEETCQAYRDGREDAAELDD